MAEKLHAFDYLHKPGEYPPAAVCVAYGDETFLRRLALAELREAVLEGDDEAPYELLDGDTAQWRDVHDELATVSLFGSSRRLVVVDDADPFVTQYRSQLEDYVAKPSKVGVLVLVLNSFPGNTRLYKAVAKTGLAIQCTLPEKGGRSKAIDEGRVLKWLGQRAKKIYGIQLEATALEELFALAGPELGMVDQNLAKLSLYAEEGEKISPLKVRDIVGGWRAKSMWDLGDSAAGGEAGEALEQLDHVIAAGEHPNAIFGQLAWSLRRYAAAAQIIEQAQEQKKRVNLQSALQEAGFKPFPQGALEKAEKQLRQLGSSRANQLYRWLLETDLALKGTHSQPKRGHLELEKLIARMSQQAAPPKPARPQRSPR